MNAWMRRRVLMLGAVVCAGLGFGAVLAVQASASGSGSPTPAASAAPNLPPRPAGAPEPHAVTPHATATNAHCGQVLTASLTLNGDLSCGGAGLIIAGNSVNLNLGGHVISGPGIAESYDDGVEVEGTSDTVQNGVIANFDVGVSVDDIGKTDTILNLRAVSNDYGVLDYGTGTKITTSTAARSLYNGIYAQGTGGTYSGDHEVSNGGHGLYIYFGVSKLIVTSNIANGNGYYGILDSGVGTKLTTNTANFNAQDGIYIHTVDVTVIDGGGNAAKGNDHGSGQVSNQCTGIVCT